MSDYALRRIGPHDAGAIAEMGARYPEAMRHGESTLRARLGSLATSPGTLAWLCEDGEGRCLGYLVAWRGRSLVDVPNPESVVFIDDLQAADPRALYPLLVRLAQDIEVKSLLALPIEGVCRRDAYRLFRDHDKAIRRLGYALHAHYEYWDETLGEALCWMRWRSLRVVTGPDRQADAWAPRQVEEGVSEWDSFNETVESLGNPDEERVALRHAPPPPLEAGALEGITSDEEVAMAEERVADSEAPWRDKPI